MSGRKVIGKQLSKARKEKGFTQSQISESSGLDQAIISKIENGRFNGSLRIFEDYLDALDFELDISPKKRVLPRFDEIEGLYGED
ncbi:helix-turn-helix transcriptional regulator [Amphritea atlantica]|jgi:transcriptional regulator with XRE-family HTH domain|uniref:Helix-turn-helix transcriptional regulator n=1 Tax=Amphritea atlantica TaxID=355243 RepID=A0ABY5GU61_9GAMM|nr:helix-turn-helix transcriptional regulator [Amphritea atlantica]